MKFFPSGIFQCLLLVIIWLLIIAIIYLLYNIFDFDIEDYQLTTYIFLISSLTLIIILFLYNIKNKEYRIKVNFNGFNLLPKTVLLLLIYQILILAPLQNAFLESNKRDNFTLLFFLNAILISPIIEETIFRGFILRGLLIKHKPIYAITFSMLLFSITHLNVAQISFVQLLTPIYTGVLLGYLFYKTNNLLLSITTHSISNMLGIMSQMLFDNIHQKTNMSISNLKIVYSLLITIAILFIMIMLRKNNK